MAELEFTIPGKGKPKARARGVTADGHVYTPKKTVNAEALVKMVASQALGDRPLLRGALRLTMIATFPIPSSWPRWMKDLAAAGAIMPTVTPDWDNIGKLVADGLNTIAYADDKVICKSYVEKRYGERSETWVHFVELYSQELIDRLEGRTRPGLRVAA